MEFGIGNLEFQIEAMYRDPDGSEKNAVEEILGPRSGITLEVGCGDGRLTKYLAELCRSLYALDPDPVTIKDAKDLLFDKVRFIIGSGEKLPFPEGRFDTVVFSLSLHHQDSETALSEALRVLRNQGRVLILEPEAESPINRLFRLINNEDGAYARAAAAVRTCSLNLADYGSFTSLWRFDSFNEMVKHLYSFFDRKPDPNGIKAMENILACANRECPLDIEDSTRWWLLSTP